MIQNTRFLNRYQEFSGRINTVGLAGNIANTIVNNNINTNVIGGGSVSTWTMPLTGPSIENGQPVKSVPGGYWRSLYYEEGIVQDNILNNVGDALELKYEDPYVSSCASCQIGDNKYLIIKSAVRSDEGGFYNSFDATIIRTGVFDGKFGTQFISNTDLKTVVIGTNVTNIVYNPILNRGVFNYLDYSKDVNNPTTTDCLFSINNDQVVIGISVSNEVIGTKYGYFCENEDDPNLLVALYSPAGEFDPARLVLYNSPDSNTLTLISSAQIEESLSPEKFCPGSIQYMKSLSPSSGNSYRYAISYSDKNYQFVSNVFSINKTTRAISINVLDNVVLQQNLYPLYESNSVIGNYTNPILYKVEFNECYFCSVVYKTSDQNTGLAYPILLFYKIGGNLSPQFLSLESIPNAPQFSKVDIISYIPVCIDKLPSGNICTVYNTLVGETALKYIVYNKDDLSPSIPQSGNIEVFNSQNITESNKYSSRWICCNKYSDIESVMIFNSVPINSSENNFFVSVVGPKFETIDGQSYAGISQKEAKEGESVTVDLLGSLSSAKTGLLPGAIYSISNTGELTTNVNKYKAGIAVTSDKFLISST